MTEKSCEIIDQRLVYDGFFKLSKISLRHSLFNGGLSPVVVRELFHRGSCVAVIPYDPVADTVVLIEQFRVGALGIKADPWLLEIVAGAVEEGESAEAVAHRECLEEAGCVVKRLIRIGEFFPTPGGCSEKVTLFCGVVDSAGVGGIHGLAEEHEDIRVSVVDFSVAMGMMQDGLIDTAMTFMGLQWLALNRFNVGV